MHSHTPRMRSSPDLRPPLAASVYRGFTIIELLVAISVIGVILAILLPAVQRARSAARTVACQNNLRQIGAAFLDHEAATGRFPSNGWGYGWVGDPDRGTDERQPGGWIYNILPYLEQNSMRLRGSGLSETEKRAALKEVMSTPMPLFRCPMRPSPELSLFNLDLAPVNADWTPLVAKTDYAVCEGDYITDTRTGPETLKEGDSGKYKWRDTSKATGVCFQRSNIQFKHIRDGASNTYLVGDKYVSSEHYLDDSDLGHDQSMYVGVDLDINRWTIDPPLQDAPQTAERRFGSAHLGACCFVMCDGSVRQISYNVDESVHRWLGNRNDGNTVEVP